MNLLSAAYLFYSLCTKKINENLRTGNFTPEEVEYCQAVIADFKRGYLDTIQGQSISKYLAKKLSCKVPRVQKKFPSILHLKPFRLVKIGNCKGDIEQQVQDARVSFSSEALLVQSLKWAFLT